MEFPSDFDRTVTVGDLPGNGAFFGRDVLRGLVDGITDFRDQTQERWIRRTHRTWGVGLLGSAMWIDDPELIDALATLSGSCVVITKQPRTKHQLDRLERLREATEPVAGVAQRAFPELGGLAPRIDGRPQVIGPYDEMDHGAVDPVRSLGYRTPDKRPVPIMHAKLAVLGHFWWHDEGPLGHPDDIIGFRAIRLWVGSANFTKRSRSSLEFGYWTEDATLVEEARRFLLTSIRLSESLDPDADELDPEFAPVEFDDAAMADAAAELWTEDEW